MKMLQYIIEIKQAFENKDPIWLVVIYGLLVFAVVLKWKDLWLPKYRLKYLILNLLIIFTITLSSIGLLKGLMFYLVLVLLAILVVVFYCSSLGNLLWPCSSINREISNFLKANESEKAEKMLYRYRWCFLDPTEKYSYNIQKAAIAAAKGNIRRSIEILSKTDKKALNEDENLRLELEKAGYFSQLGDYKKAKWIVEHLPKNSDKYLLQVSLIQALSSEFEGNLEESSKLLLDAITICSDGTKDTYYKVALNNLGRIRRLEGNYTDSLFYYRKSLTLAKNLGNKSTIHIAYQNVIYSLILVHKLEEGRQLIQEYQSMVDFNNPNDLQEYYNFLIEFYRQIDNQNKLFETLDEASKRIYPIISRKEQLIYDISQLRMRWNGGVLSPPFLGKIESQYPEYSGFTPEEKFKCYMEIHHVLQALNEIGFLGTYINLFNINRMNIGIIIPELEEYLTTIPEYCVSEKCQVMKDIVIAKKCSNVDYDKDEVLRMLGDIKETYLKHGNIIEAFNTGLDICDEALGQKRDAEMWEFTKLAINEIQQISGHPDTIPAFIRIALYAYRTGKFDISRKYIGLYEKTGIHISHYADWIQNYYYATKQELDKVG